MTDAQPIKSALAALVEKRVLSELAVEQCLEAILGGQASPAQIGGFLLALRMKGESLEDLVAAARVMRRHAVPVRVAGREVLVDTCGTGGDGSDSFNISTVAAIVVAAAGLTVAKHGNRAATSRCGSADLLEALGIRLDLSPDRVGRCIEQVGIGFMFARVHHPAMKHAAPVRAELGVRTLFNWLGPLTNPAGATHQLLGLSDPARLEDMAQALARLGSKAAWVVHGHGGLDEVSLSGPTRVVALQAGEIRRFEVRPEDFGLGASEPGALRGGDAAQNAAMTRALLEGERGARRDSVIANAAATLCMAGAAGSPREGAERAAAAIDSGAAKAKLQEWIAFCAAA
jgi:anthranilate phosphoribosyltransferase